MVERTVELVRSGHLVRVLWFTLWQAGASMVLTLALALPGAYVFARFDFPGKRLIQALTTIPFVLPTVVAAAAFRALLGRGGLVDAWWPGGPASMFEQSIGAILLAHVFYNYTVVLRMVGGFWARLEPALTEAARMLGASGWTAFRKVTLPLITPAVAAAGLLVFLFCFTSFGVVLILGGPRMATIEVEIYRQAMHLFHLPLAAALSLVQIAFTLAVMLVYLRIERGAALSLNPEPVARTWRKPRAASERVLVAVNLLVMLLLLGLPLLALMVRSVSTDTGWSLLYYKALFVNIGQSVFHVPPIWAAVNSLAFALTVTILALSLGLPAAVHTSGVGGRGRGWAEPLIMLPLSTSAVTLGLGFIVALDRPPLNLRSSVALVPLAHTLVALPFVLRCLVPALRSIPAGLREAATVLGASPSRVFRLVDLPIIGRALLVAAMFAFAVSMGEFGATAFTARPQTPTMPVAIYRFLGQPGALNYGQAMAMSSLLMLVTASGFLALEFARRGPGGDF